MESYQDVLSQMEIFGIELREKDLPLKLDKGKRVALAHQLGLHKWSALDWKRLRDKLIPPNLDLFAPAQVAPVAPVAPVMPLPMPEPLPPVAPVPASEPAALPPAPQKIPTPEPETTAQTVRASVPPPPQPAVSEPVAPAPPTVPAPAPLAPAPVATAINRAPVGRRILSRGIR